MPEDREEEEEERREVLAALSAQVIDARAAHGPLSPAWTLAPHRLQVLVPQDHLQDSIRAIPGWVTCGLNTACHEGAGWTSFSIPRALSSPRCDAAIHGKSAGLVKKVPEGHVPMSEMRFSNGIKCY